MKVKKQKLQGLNSVLSVLLIMCIIVLNVHVNVCWAMDDEIVKKNNIITSMVRPASSTEETVINDPEDNENVTSTEKYDAEPQSQKTSTGSILLYSGIGVAAVVAVAAAVSVGGSSDSVSETTTTTTTTSTPTPTPTTKTPTTPKPTITTPKDNNPVGAEPVGADVGGDNWSGFIDLVGFQRESISSSISQHGNFIVITTSSHQKYGQKLVGNIAADGFMKLFDQRTGEDWTTHFGNATANKVDIYDFVNTSFQEVDQIFLQR